MKNFHTPTRMCMVCRTRHPKYELARIVKDKNGQIFYDNSFKAEGRGAYLCKSSECLAKFQKTRALNRIFKQEVPQETYTKILVMVENDLD